MDRDKMIEEIVTAKPPRAVTPEQAAHNLSKLGDEGLTELHKNVTEAARRSDEFMQGLETSEKGTLVDDIIEMYPPMLGENRARQGLNGLSDGQLSDVHEGLSKAHAHATSLHANRKALTAAKADEIDGTDDGVPFSSPPEELHY